MAVLVTIFAVVVALLAVLVAGLLRSHAEILRALHELRVGLDPDTPMEGTPRAAVDIAGVAPNGDTASLKIAGEHHSTLVAFLTSSCTTCVEFWNAFADRDRRAVPGNPRIVVVTKGQEAESPARLRRFAPDDVLVVMSSTAWTAYDVEVAPYFVYVDGPSSRVVGEGAASSWAHLIAMMEQALDDAGMSATS